MSEAHADPAVADIAARGLAALRARRPLVHYMTNFVAMTPAANALLAVGASPAMIHAAEEVGEFAAVADVLAVNIGTLSASGVGAMSVAVEAARDAGKRWAFDPVGVGATRYRTGVARQLFARRPTLLRANASEILALAGEVATAQGVDAGDPVDAAAATARRLARESGGVVGVTGAVDLVTDGARAARIANGSALMPKVTALGCALTGVSAAFLAAVEDPFEATLAAFAVFALAGERAGAAAQGPGTLHAGLMDALHQLEPDDLRAGVRGAFD